MYNYISLVLVIVSRTFEIVHHRILVALSMIKHVHVHIQQNKHYLTCTLYTTIHCTYTYMYLKIMVHEILLGDCSSITYLCIVCQSPSPPPHTTRFANRDFPLSS